MPVTALLVIIAGLALAALLCRYLYHQAEHTDPRFELPHDIPSARTAMHLHSGCSAEWCAVKHAAYWMLVDAGVITPTEQAARKRAMRVQP